MKSTTYVPEVLNLRDTIKIDTKEYAFGNAVYGFLNLLELALNAFQDKDFSLVGNETGLRTMNQQPNK